MAHRPKLHDFLYGCAGLVFILLAIAIKQDLIGFQSYGNQSRAIQQIRKAVNENAAEIKIEMAMIKTQIQNNELSFSSLLERAHHPSYIYKNGTLLYWNYNKFIPDPVSLKPYGSQQLLVTSNGKFLVFREKFRLGNESYMLLNMLRLTYRYPFSNEYLKQGINSDIFPSGNVKVNSNRSDNNLFAGDGTFLFSIDFSELPQDNTKSLVCFLVGCIFMIIAFSRALFRIKRSLGFDISFLFLLSVVGVFGFFIYTAPSFLLDPGALVEFNSASKLINMVWVVLSILTVLAFVFRFGLESEFVKKLMRAVKMRFFYLFILIVLNTVLLIVLYEFTLALYREKETSISIRNLFDPGRYIIVAILIFIVLSINYFLSGHLVSRFLQHNIHRLKPQNLVLSGALVILFFSILGYAFSFLWLALTLFNLAYLALVYKLKLAPTLGRIRYVTYIYFFACAVVCSLSAAIGFGVSDQLKIQENSRKIALKIVREEKLVDERLFNEASARISDDKFIAEIILNPLSDKKLVEQKIKRYYLADVIDKYDIRAYLYDNEGRSIDDNSTRNYFSIYKNIDNQTYKTAFKKVFRQRGINSGYFCPVIIRQDKGTLDGYVLIELKLRKVIPYSILPALLLEKSGRQSSGVNNSSYAIYDKGSLVSSFGEYNYFKDFKQLSPEQIQSISKGMISGGKFHQLFSFPDHRDVLVSTDYQLLRDTLSNFSFLFQVLALLLAGIILSNTFYYKLRQVSSTFTTKIQLFINFAFFIPLVVVCIAVFYIISYSYKEELQKDFINKAEAISNRLMVSFNGLAANQLSEDGIVEGLNEAARFSQTDVNLYDINGKLIESTQPKIFEFSILSRYINPEAMKDLIENKEMYALIPEQIGNLRFNTVYYKIKSYNTGEMLGTLAIPYFGSDKEIQDKILEALIVVLNVFTVIFILFLAASFFASRLLTAPLSLLTNKIKQTSLNKDNDPLVYHANDEIGLLVNEYNRMLLKMDDSKKALSASEKEAAWREMARQVAHEIKNPLTPMKLTLQNLQRMIRSGNTDSKEMTERSIIILLDQIENLSDIAGSFSAFTQMPLPKLEKFDMGALLSKSVFLFNSSSDAMINSNIEPGSFIVEGDEKLMNRIFINLLTNAFEAVNEEVNPNISVSLQKKTDTVRIEIADNGKGIPDAYISKVFQPNFSTKTSGSGIGLAVAKRGIEQMGGKIWFITSINKGTSFYVEMPLIQN